MFVVEHNNMCMFSLKRCVIEHNLHSSKVCKERCVKHKCVS